MAAAFSWETTSSCRAEDLVIGDVDLSKFVEELVNFLWCHVGLSAFMNSLATGVRSTRRLLSMSM